MILNSFACYSFLAVMFFGVLIYSIQNILLVNCKYIILYLFDFLFLIYFKEMININSSMQNVFEFKLSNAQSIALSSNKFKLYHKFSDTVSCILKLEPGPGE